MVHNDMAKYKDGFEVPDSTPVALPVGYEKPKEADRLHDLMSRLFVEMRDAKDTDSFEDSLDFYVDDEEDFVSPSEMRYMTEEKLLTDAEEADKVVRHRRDVYKFKERYYAKRKGSGSADGDAGDVKPGGKADSSVGHADVKEVVGKAGG